MAGTARFAAWCAAMSVLALAACGGSSEPSAEEKRAAGARWVQHVDATCRKADDAIADHGWPMNLIDLDRLVVRGIGDSQAAIEKRAEEAGLSDCLGSAGGHAPRRDEGASPSRPCRAAPRRR